MENQNRIKGALADAGKTGVWLAGQLGKDPVTVSKWCTNTTQPDLYALQKVQPSSTPHPVVASPQGPRKIQNIDIFALCAIAAGGVLLCSLPCFLLVTAIA